MQAIDWSTAQRVGELLAGSPAAAGAGIGGESLQSLADSFARSVSDYALLALPPELPPLETVDRPAWIAANLKTMQPVLEPLMQQAGGLAPRRRRRSFSSRGQDLAPLYDALNAAGGLLLGAQVGAMAGMLSQRVLGQYDLALLDSSVHPRLLLVAPNLAQAARTMQVDREQLVAWVTIHELTHAIQFSGAPWLRAHLGGLLRELIEGLQVNVSLGSLLRLPDARDVRTLAERVRRGEVLRLTLGEERWQLVARMQATMSLIEGHAEHVMDAVGAEVLPALPRLRAAMTRRRETRGLPWRVLERLLGLELKLRQYEEGRRFCDAVVAAGDRGGEPGVDGRRLLARAWRSPADLPDAAELAAPERWIARVA
ncbi:MAG TPA: zinc-dependent metalloprotease [Solirubrobacteraceae bacterium]|nr:zinc-dependent metalloprotease [Solirubrobacteraceae bacterium]